MCNYGHLTFLGDHNFILHRLKIWKESTRLNSFDSFLLNNLEAMNLIDVEPLDLKPIWKNNQGNVNKITKRLDIFLIHEYLPLQV